MFTGLIRTQGTVTRVEQRGDRVLTIAPDAPFALSLGASVACHGICLTVVEINGDAFRVSLSAETLNCTTARDWAVGTRINLEPSLRVGDELGGHFVSGHVDGVARVIGREESGDSTVWEFEAPVTLAQFIAAKGSITIDGVSLTVNRVSGQHFLVNIIPHTAQVTSFGALKVGGHANLEIDMLARYVARLAESA
jgi:riboflavin synthase